MAEGQNGKKKKTRAYLLIIAVVIIMAVLLALVSIFDLPFRWAFELIIIILSTIVVYYILKKYFYSYGYEIIGNNFTVKQKIGSNDRFILAIDLDNILEISDSVEPKDTSFNIAKVDKLHDDSQNPERCLIYKDDNGTVCMLRFTPDDDLIKKILPADS